MIGINPVSDNLQSVETLLRLLDRVRESYRIPTQSCVLAHVTTTMDAMRRGAPVDLVFQSIAGTEAANASFGVNIAMLREAREQALELRRGTVGDNVMYFETGQGSALSANAHHGVDQQTCEARAYGLARHFQPLLVNTVVGFIGPNICTTASRFCARDWKIISAASCWAFPWAATSATPTTPRPIKTTWTRC